MAKKYVHTTGRRKTSVARATMHKGSGKITVNNEDADSYAGNELLILRLKEPLKITGSEGKYDIKVNVFGGGVNSQVDAIRQAIARGIVEMTDKEDIKKEILEYDRTLLVSDARLKEMNKPNNSNPRAKRQKSYR